MTTNLVEPLTVPAVSLAKLLEVVEDFKVQADRLAKAKGTAEGWKFLNDQRDAALDVRNYLFYGLLHLKQLSASGDASAVGKLLAELEAELLVAPDREFKSVWCFEDQQVGDRGYRYSKVQELWKRLDEFEAARERLK